MGDFGVSEPKAERLRRRLDRLGVGEEHLRERFIRSGGPGGQNVNKVSTCVSLLHLPSGLEVRVQRERSQALNRFLARQLLAEKLEAERRRLLEERKSQAHRLRRQKAGRSRAAKRRMLAGKRIHSLKKRLRGRAGPDE